MARAALSLVRMGTAWGGGGGRSSFFCGKVVKEGLLGLAVNSANSVLCCFYNMDELTLVILSH